MAVAPVIGVYGEEGRNHAEPFDAVELILADGLAMDDDVPRVGPGVRLLRFLKGVEDVFDARVAVAVDGELQPCRCRPTTFSMNCCSGSIG